MHGKYLHCWGLFLAAFAAFSLALGQPQVLLAATEKVNLSDVERMIDTKEGRAALAKTGISAEKFKAMLARLSPEQREKLGNMVKNSTPEARLTARMMAAGYTKPEVDQRLAVLTADEIATLADDPAAMTAGTGVCTVILVTLLVLVAVGVSWYFVAIEEPIEPAPAPEAEAPPAE